MVGYIGSAFTEMKEVLPGSQQRKNLASRISVLEKETFSRRDLRAAPST